MDHISRLCRKFLQFLFVYLFTALLGLHCCSGFSLFAANGGYSLVAVQGLLIVEASLFGRTGFRVWGLPSMQHVGSAVVAPGPWGAGSLVMAPGPWGAGAAAVAPGP